MTHWLTCSYQSLDGEAPLTRLNVKLAGTDGDEALYLPRPHTSQGSRQRGLPIAHSSTSPYVLPLLLPQTLIPSTCFALRAATSPPTACEHAASRHLMPGWDYGTQAGRRAPRSCVQRHQGCHVPPARLNETRAQHNRSCTTGQQARSIKRGIANGSSYLLLPRVARRRGNAKQGQLTVEKTFINLSHN